MIIYGSRMYGKRNLVRSFGACAHCGHYVQHRSYDGRKWGHLYFIPLVPMGGHVRVMKECSKCSMGQHVPLDAVGQVYGEVERLVQSCIEAALAGQHTFPDAKGGEPVPTGPFLSDAIDKLYTTGHADDIPGLIGLLPEDEAPYERAIARSAYLDLQGKRDEAQAAMQAAAEAEPALPYPHAQLAYFASLAGKPAEQLEHLREADRLAGGDVGIMVQMLGPLEALKQFDELVRQMDACIAKAPELGQDKQFAKLRKKNQKKAEKAAMR